MRIALISGVFPKVSETFVMRHAADLLDHGHEVDIFSDYRPRENEFPASDPLAEELRDRTIYMDVPSLRGGQRLLSAPRRLARCARVAPRLAAASLSPSEYGLRALSLSQMNRLYTLAREPRSYDVIHAHFGMVGDRFRFASALWNTPLAVSFHGFDYSVWPLTHGKDCYRRLFEVAAHIVVNSENTRRRVEMLSCPPEKIVKIYPHWDMAGFPYRPHDHTAGQPFRVLTVARLVDIKGVDDGLRAVALARRAHSDIRYDIVGEGPLRAELETLIHSLGLGDSVTLHGAQPHRAVSRMMASAHAFLLTSRTAGSGDEEGLGIALLEAQAAGLPVIATQHGAFPEVVAHGETGLLAPERSPETLARYLTELIEKPELRRQMGAAGRRRVEDRFAPATITERYETLYQEMLDERHASIRAGIGTRLSAAPAASEAPSPSASRQLQDERSSGSQRQGPLHIALLSRSVEAHHVGGMETHGESLRRALVAAGHRVTTLTTALPQGPATVHDACGPIHFLAGGRPGAYSRAWHRALVRTLLELHERDPFDIVASQSAAAFPYLALRERLPARQRIPTVVMSHGGVLAALPGHLEDLRRHPAQILLKRLPKDALLWESFRQGLPRADHITVLSHTDEAEIRRWFSIDADHITVIPNGVNVDVFTPSDTVGASVRARLGLADGEIAIAVLASLEPRKGQHVMLDALASAPLREAHARRPIRLVLIGDGPSREALRSRAERLGLADRVLFANAIPHEDTPTMLNGMDIVALPSTAEGMPLALLEAMACGRAVVASRVGAIGSVITDGVTGLLVPPGDALALAGAIERLVNDPAYRARLGARARERVALRYDEALSMACYEKVFRQVAVRAR
jgi:colanic acid/amylovoran/stewartan biosynthesis glycosyltransferase WcaL/AmsK/CpsK